MKTLLFVSLLTGSLLAEATTIKGVVKNFSGVTVETNRPYSYKALSTTDGKRLVLPKWINASKVPANVPMTFDAQIDPMFCTDMSAACATGAIVNVKSMSVTLAMTVVAVETFEGPLKKFSGRAVETPVLYSYVAIDAQDRIAVPELLNTKELFPLNPMIKVSGTPEAIFCTDMSAACGPTVLKPVTAIRVKF